MASLSKAGSIELLCRLVKALYPADLSAQMQAYYTHALADSNPVWETIKSQPFYSDSGHLLAMRDPRNPNMGLIGFFESAKEPSGLIADAAKWLVDLGCKQIVGPFDGSILQRYRFNVDDNMAFTQEPINPKSYIDYFTKAGFKPYLHYVSARRTDLRTILNPMESAKVLPQGYLIRQFDNKNFEKDLETIYALSIEAFRGTSPYFVPYNFREFAYWYMTRKDILSTKYCELLYHKEQPIGACLSFVENNNLLMKTIGVLPQYQSTGASQLLIYSQHKKAQQDKLDAVIYALIRTGNNVTKMPYPGVSSFRHYQTMVLT